MIRKKTAFIIGAGASKAYNMPTGIELRQEIVQSSGVANYLASLSGFGFSPEKYKEFCIKFLASNVESIDEFLNYNREYIYEGKTAIAYFIKKAEIESATLINNVNWIQYLFNRMLDGIENCENADMFGRNQVYFCIFNYDRLFEYAISSSYLNTFSANKTLKERYYREGLQGIVDNIGFDIDHVYGKIGDLRKNKINEKKLEMISSYYSDIILINERENEYRHIKEKLSECERVFFLGYGFNTKNNQTLALQEICSNKIAYATGYNLLPEELHRIGLAFGSNLYINNCDCMSLLRMCLSEI